MDILAAIRREERKLEKQLGKVQHKLRGVRAAAKAERLAAERQSRIVFPTVGATLPILSFNLRNSRFH